MEQYIILAFITIYVISFLCTCFGGWYTTRNDRYITVGEIMQIVFLATLPIVNTIFMMSFFIELINDTGIVHKVIYERKNKP